MPKAIDICICTFRRDHIVATLHSLARMRRSPDWLLHVYVADNDDTPSARALVEDAATLLPFPLTYLHAPARNISVARNACLAAAQAPFLAFIDDDEVVSEAWLWALVETQEREQADAVLGPVKAVYGPDCPDWIVAGDFHASRPVWVNGQIITGYSCNVLLRRKIQHDIGLKFRVDLGRSGGEDTVFFSTLHRAGGYIAYAPDAVVMEAVPDNRAQLDWLFKRRYRFGQTHGLLLTEGQVKDRRDLLRAIAVAASKALVCFAAAPLNVFRRDRLLHWLLRGTLHAGVVSHLIGQRTADHYGKEETA
jgi:succinoglycan biosynthesis protein ExoM